MATTGNISLLKGIPTIEDAFVVIVKTEWNASIVDALESGAISILNAAAVAHETLVVPGAVELTFAVRAHALQASRKADAYIVLGTVIKGDTPHFEYVCQSVTDGVTALNLQLQVPTIFGVLTVLTATQAAERIGGIHGHKGEEAAITALKMIHLQRNLQ
ncbi:MAG: 6,7-dimethyl-8-ribityllumazine synthase [Chitinophagaceae bacterium]